MAGEEMELTQNEQKRRDRQPDGFCHQTGQAHAQWATFDAQCFSSIGLFCWPITEGGRL